MTAGRKGGRGSGGGTSPLGRLARLLGLSPAPRSQAGIPGDEIQRIAESGLFDAAFYAAQVEGKAAWQDLSFDTSEAGLIAHYLRHGAAAWLNPSRTFDTGLYLQTHAEVARSGENPLLDFLRSEPQGAAPRVPEGLPPPTSRVVAATRRAFVLPATMAARNTTRYRVQNLFELVDDDALTLVDPAEPPPDFFAEVDRGAIVVLQRVPFTAENASFLEEIRSRAALVAYDIDDQLFDANVLEDWRIRGLEHAPGAYARCMSLADHFLVSTTGLRDTIQRRFGRPAHVVTNCLGREVAALSAAAVDEKEAAERPFVLGYASGSHTHDEDLRVALPAIEAFLRANPAAEFHAIGHMAFPEALRTAFGDRVRHRKPVSWRKLPGVLASFSAQLVPLADCPFNRCKSHIRVLEAAAVKVPSIVSDVGEPATTAVDGVTGLVCGNDPAAWQQAMQSLHDDPALRHRLAESTHRFVLENYTTDAPAARARVGRVLDTLGLRRDAA